MLKMHIDEYKWGPKITKSKSYAPLIPCQPIVPSFERKLLYLFNLRNNFIFRVHGDELTNHNIRGHVRVLRAQLTFDKGRPFLSSLFVFALHDLD